MSKLCLVRQAPAWDAPGTILPYAADIRSSLDYHDIEVGLADRKAIVINGRVLELRFRDATYLVVLAFTQIFGKSRPSE